jgi:N-acetyl-alpha-D-muramate 1-phosphate uridylyltransferase
LPPGPALIVSGDIWTAFDYATLLPHAAAMAHDPALSRVHLVMVPNPPFHPSGDFILVEGRRDSSDHGVPIGPLRIPTDEATREGSCRRTFGNIGLYDTALFRELPRGLRLPLLPFFRRWIAEGLVRGELYTGPWANVGTPDELVLLDAALRAGSTTMPMGAPR